MAIPPKNFTVSTQNARVEGVSNQDIEINTENETEKAVRTFCAAAVAQSMSHHAIVGISKRAWAIRDRALELIAVEEVRQESPELAGDSVARREVDARLAQGRSKLGGRIGDLAHRF